MPLASIIRRFDSRTFDQRAVGQRTVGQRTVGKRAVGEKRTVRQTDVWSTDNCSIGLFVNERLVKNPSNKETHVGHWETYLVTHLAEYFW